MENFEQHLYGDVLIESVNLLRATKVEASIMKSRLFEDIKLNNKSIIVDIRKCKFLDSTFLGALVVSLKKTRKTGGDIKLVITSSSFADGIVDNSGILRIFEIYTSAKDALKSYEL
jgi:anti-sigma B factor antagonist